MLLRFLTDIKAGRGPVQAPVYSHLVYDVVPGETIEVERPDILIVEGLNVLQPNTTPEGRQARAVRFGLFSISRFISMRRKMCWKAGMCSRFMRLRETAFRDPKSYFNRYSKVSDEEAKATALSLWRDINLVNLHENILPTRLRASLILCKNADHQIETVAPAETLNNLGGVGGPLRACPARVRDRAVQRFSIERLHHERIHAGGKARFAVFRRGIRRERDDRYAARALERADAAPSLPSPVHAGKMQIHQHEIERRADRMGARDRLHGGDAVADHGRDVAELAEHRLRQQRVDVVVFRDQDRECALARKRAFGVLKDDRDRLDFGPPRAAPRAKPARSGFTR